MKTVLLSTSYMDGCAGNGDSYMERIKKFVAYYKNPELKALLGYTSQIFLDNGSQTPLDRSVGGIEVIRFPNLQHGSHGRLQYPAVWRAIYYAQNILSRFDKIIWMDNDSFILSPHMAEEIGKIDYGWVAPWSNMHNFPESNLSVICGEGGGEALSKWASKMEHEARAGRMFETSLPYTSVRKDFVGDRYGDLTPAPEQSPEMDWYTNARLGTELVFNKYGKKDDDKKS